MSTRLLNKIAIVTGSSSGLGRAISLSYAREGAKVVCADLTPSARMNIQDEGEIYTHELIQKEGGQAIFVTTDVGEANDMQALVQAATNEFGRLDILVNNAGVGLEARRSLARCHETDEEVWDATMKVNAKSIFLGCKYAITQMLAQEPHSSGDRGWIINMSSIMATIAGKTILIKASYCASKGAVGSLTRQVALDYAADRIHVNAICPGYTQTAIFTDAMAAGMSLEDMQRKHPFNGPGKPSDIAKIAVVLASDDASWVTGAAWAVDGGYTAR
ncbi:NAD(P)-binding protein [Penicillium longicatenatum]|uniref:NAD(P)-binding protein n=1 Tax=Penicillium longicatenatum TaxID=1561947 RepID=UPI002549AB87|nr:NAD(P)-binding protein [Penicillium longicatenatum]KAJ5649377.1 NAD(P)-binding protein [Penicillium longicatenatum]